MCSPYKQGQRIFPVQSWRLSLSNLTFNHSTKNKFKKSINKICSPTSNLQNNRSSQLFTHDNRWTTFERIVWTRKTEASHDKNWQGQCNHPTSTEKNNELRNNPTHIKISNIFIFFRTNTPKLIHIYLFQDQQPQIITYLSVSGPKTAN